LRGSGIERRKTSRLEGDTGIFFERGGSLEDEELVPCFKFGFIKYRLILTCNDKSFFGAETD